MYGSTRTAERQRRPSASLPLKLLDTTMKAIKRLLEECEKCSYDNLGFIHYIPKEIYDDAKREYDEILDLSRKSFLIAPCVIPSSLILL